MKTIDPRLWVKIKSWPEDRQIEFEERAAIIEYDGGYSRAVAEQRAFEEISALHAIHALKHPRTS